MSRIKSALDIARRYAGGGEVSDAKMARQISERAMRGLEPTPEQKQYLDNMKELRGKQNDEIVSDLTPSSIVMPDAGMARRVSNRAMSGREDFTPEEQSHISGSLPGKEQRSEGLGSIGAIGAELTGIPGILRGGERMVRPDADMLTRASGLGEVGLSLLPSSGVLREAMPLVNAATKTAPRAAATAVGLGIPGAFDDARAAGVSADNKLASIQPPDYLTKELNALKTERDAVMKQYNAMNQQHRLSGPETQRKALAPFETQLGILNGKVNEAEGRIRDFMEKATKEARAELPFRERHPGAAEGIATGAVALGTALPFAGAVKNQIGNRVEQALMSRAANKAADVFESDPVKFTEMQRALSRRAERLDQATGLPQHAMDFGKAAALSGLMQYEAAAAPELIDALSYSPGHPTRDRALEQLSSKDYYTSRALPALFWGLGTAGVGKELGHLLTPGAKVPENARAIIDRGSAQSISDLQKLGQYRQAAEAAKGAHLDAKDAGRQIAGTRQLEAEANATAPPASLGTLGSREQSPGSLASLSTAERPQPMRRSPNVEDVPSQPALEVPASFKPHEGFTGLPASTEAPPSLLKEFFGSLSPADMTAIIKSGQSGKTKHGTGGKFSSAEKEQKALVEALQKKAEEFEKNRASGGRVAKALNIAKRAFGGRVPVHTGPATHKADGGRTDTIPVNLPSSSYVIPADCVSSLGQGDTNAGYRVLEGMFGPHETKAEGGAVPAIIAGGEYVLSPEQVAKIGGGNHEVGFKALDHFVKMQRRKTIQTLKGLPPPAKD